MKGWPVIVVVLAFIFMFCVLLVARDQGVVVFVPIGWKAIDVVSILLAASALVVTGVGVAVALFSFMGWQNIKKAAIDASVDASVKASLQKAESVAARTTIDYLEMTGVSRDYSGAYGGEDEGNSDGNETTAKPRRNS